LAILKVDESILSPVSAPGVSDDPVTTLGRRVTSQLNSMINAVSALVSGEDTSVVVLPWLSITADGQWALLERLVDRGLNSGNRDNAGNSEAGVGSAAARLAVSILGSVWVAALSVKTVLLNDPSECFTRITTVASIVISIAVNDFLLRTVGNRVLSGEEVSRFDGFGGRESPARSALSLVLNGSSHSLGDPIDGTSGNRVTLSDSALTRKRLRGDESEHFLELGGREIGEFSVTEGGSLALGIEASNLASSFFEVLESTLLFGIGGISLIKH